MANPMYSDEPEVCSLHGCEMNGEHCPECDHEGHADHCKGCGDDDLVDGEYGMTCPYCSGLVRPH